MKPLLETPGLCPVRTPDILSGVRIERSATPLAAQTGSLCSAAD
jgi:hypothetical protein